MDSMKLDLGVCQRDKFVKEIKIGGPKSVIYEQSLSKLIEAIEDDGKHWWTMDLVTFDIGLHSLSRSELNPHSRSP